MLYLALVSRYSYYHIGSQFCSACRWYVGTCRWRVDGDCRLFYWLNSVTAVRKIERRLGWVNVRPTFSQWERRWSPSSTWNYVSTCKQQNTLQLTTITKIAVPLQMLLNDGFMRRRSKYRHLGRIKKFIEGDFTLKGFCSKIAFSLSSFYGYSLWCSPHKKLAKNIFPGWIEYELVC